MMGVHGIGVDMMGWDSMGWERICRSPGRNRTYACIMLVHHSRHH